jgi:alkyl sulfatase BDS1-like metallo-beta-lactamase superfamily hydrolase
VIAQAPTTFVNYHRVRIDPMRAETVDQVIVFDFNEKGKAGLHIRRGVAEFLTEPDRHYHRPDVVVSMSGESWAGLYVNQTDLASLVDAGKAKVIQGDLQSAAALLDLFDAFVPSKNFTVPQAYH